MLNNDIRVSEKKLPNRAVVGGKCRGRLGPEGNPPPWWACGNPIFIRNNYSVHDSFVIFWTCEKLKIYE